jgi:hypothetical protein
MVQTNRWWTNNIKIAVVCAFGALCIIGVIYFKQDAEWRRAGWAERHHHLFYLPPPSTLKQISLGYRAFLADLIWLRGLLYVGSHFGSERGTIEWLPRYTDAIVSLNPHFRYVYIWGSVLMLYNRKIPSREDIIESINLLKRGQKQFPHDHFFPHAIAMAYLHEIRLLDRSMSQLRRDFDEFCTKDLAPQTDRIALIKQVRSCLSQRGALYLMEAASKENAPAHYTSLATSLMQRDSSEQETICNHLLDVLWRTDNDEIRQRLHQRIQRHCETYSQATICRAEIFTSRWMAQFPYLPRSIFQFIDLETLMQNTTPISFPFPKLPEHHCNNTIINPVQ